MLPAEENFNAERVVDFLREVLAQIPGPIKLIWDRANIHRAKLTQEFLDKHTRLEAFFFPPYAPDTNPVEGVWGHAKYHQTPNLVPDDVADLRDNAETSLNEIKHDRNLVKAFIKHAHDSSSRHNRLSFCRTQ